MAQPREPDSAYWLPAYQLMLDESRRSIDNQMSSLRETRGRAGTLVGYSSIVAAALGLSIDERITPLAGIAMAAFLVVTGAAVFILYPREFRHDLGAARIEAWLRHEDNDGVYDMLRSTALAHDQNHATNSAVIRRLQYAVVVGACGVAVEAAALVAQLVL